MTTQLDSRYTAAQLGQVSGVGERTVRYYVREGLIDPPNGRGRGAHFDNRHLGQLQRVRILQEAGLDHAAIRQYGDQIEAALAKRGVARRDWEAEWARSSLDVARLYRRLKARRYVPTVSTVTRVSVADGIALLVEGEHRLPPPARLAEAVAGLRAAFDIADDATERSDRK
ncbi:MAG: helix-turn-helix domain-containing protein [Reyranellaceae bacterium]